MNNTGRNQHEEKSRSYLEKISSRYFYDASGLYKPKSHTEENNTSTDTTGRFRHFPFWITVQRDWWALGISILTLVLLFFTVHYSRKQWVAMNNTLGEATKQTIAARSTLSEVHRQTEILRDQLEGTEAAYIYIELQQKPDSLQNLKQYGLRVQFTNLGKVNAFHFEARTSLQLMKVPTFRAIGLPRKQSTDATQFLPNNPEFAFEERPSATFDMDKTTQLDVDSIIAGLTTYEFNISLTYDNGFGRTITNSKCYTFVFTMPTSPVGQNDQWLPCKIGRSIYVRVNRRS